MDGKRRHPRQGWRCRKSLSSFSSEKLEVQKLTAFFKNYIFEKRRQFLNRVIPATDGGVQKHYRVFAKQKPEVQKLTSVSIFEPSRELHFR